MRALMSEVRQGGVSESPPCRQWVTTVLTGTWANKHRVYSNQIRSPDYRYWDIFRLVKQHNPDLNTALFSTWEDNRTKLLGHGRPEAGGDKLDYYFDGFENDEQRFPHDEAREYIRQIDDLVSREAARYLAEHGPDLSWVYLEFTDDIGHLYGDGDEMAAAITLMDTNVGRIWRSVQARQQAEDEDWLVLITTDHGRDAQTGKSHGGQTDRERTIWIATNSAALNEHFSNLPAIVDILPSLLTHLEVAVPQAVSEQFDGKSFIDARRPGSPDPESKKSQRSAICQIQAVDFAPECGGGVLVDVAINASAQQALADLAGNGSVLLQSPAGEIVFSLNADMPLVPASLLKIPLAQAALTALGEDYRFETHFYQNARGDLLVRGLGDPFLVSEEIALIAKRLAQQGCSEFDVWW